MESDDRKPNGATSSYAGPSISVPIFTGINVPVEKQKDIPVTENRDTLPKPSLPPPHKRLDPQLLENHYIELKRAAETAIQDMGQHMHSVVNEIVGLFEKQHRKSIQNNLTTCRNLMKDIQQMEAEQDLMNYQIEVYTQKVRQALQQVFNKNTENK